MEPRPRIKLILSLLDKIIEWLCVLLFAMLWLLTIYFYFKMPQTIPTHFNGFGKPDSFGDKGTLFISPIIGSLIYVGMTTLNKYPHVFNYLSTITTENARDQYGIATRTLRFIKLVVLVIFNAIVLYTYFITEDAVGELAKWFLPMIFALIILPIIYFIIQVSGKNKDYN